MDSLILRPVLGDGTATADVAKTSAFQMDEYFMAGFVSSVGTLEPWFGKKVLEHGVYILSGRSHQRMLPRQPTGGYWHDADGSWRASILTAEVGCTLWCRTGHQVLEEVRGTYAASERR